MHEAIEPEPPPDSLLAPQHHQVHVFETTTIDSDPEEDMYSCHTHHTKPGKIQSPIPSITQNIPNLMALDVDEYSSDDDSLFNNWDATFTEKQTIQEVMCNLQNTAMEDLFPAIQTCEIDLDETKYCNNDDIYLTENHKDCTPSLHPPEHQESAVEIEGVDIFPTHVTQNEWSTWYGRSEEEELQIHSSSIGNHDACYKSAIDRLDALIEEHYFFDCATIPKAEEVEDNFKQDMKLENLNEVIQTLSHAQVTTTSVTPTVLQELMQTSQEIDMIMRI